MLFSLSGPEIIIDLYSKEIMGLLIKAEDEKMLFSQVFRKKTALFIACPSYKIVKTMLSELQKQNFTDSYFILPHEEFKSENMREVNFNGGAFIVGEFPEKKDLSSLKIDALLFHHSLIDDRKKREFLDKKKNFSPQTRWVARGVETLDDLRKIFYSGIQFASGRFFGKCELSENYIALKTEKIFMGSLYFKRGYNYFLKEMYDESILEFTKAQELASGDMELFCLKGFAFYYDKCYIAALKEGEKISPENPDGWLIKGLSYDKMGDLKNAFSCYRYFLHSTGKHPYIKKVEQRVSELKRDFPM